MTRMQATSLLFYFVLFGNVHELARAQTGSTGGTSTRLSLAASNPFRMVLRPTFFELDFVALSIVEDAMATAILLSTDSSLVDVNININQMNWISTTDDGKDELIDGTVNVLGQEDVPATVLRFFAVGTFLLNVPAGSPSNSGSLVSVKKLDGIIEAAFLSENSAAFIEILRNSQDPLLQSIQDVAAIPTNQNLPAPNIDDRDDGITKTEPESDDLSLTTLDIVLIAVSGAIFLGIVYMIFQHHKDRGYIENQRLRALNSYRPTDDSRRNPNRSYRSDEDSKPEKTHRSIADSNRSADDSSRTSVVNNRGSKDEHPSNTSSLFTPIGDQDQSFATNFTLPPSPSDLKNHRNPKRARFSSKVKISVESTQQYDTMSLPPSMPKPMTTNSSIQSYDDKSECKSTGALSTALSSALSADFGAINWFRKSTSKGLSALMASTDAHSDIEEHEEEESSFASKQSAEGKQSSTSSTSNTSDVFQVGYINTDYRNSVAADCDNVSKASSVVTEWMKTIRVIPSSESKSGSDVTCKAWSSEEESSTAENCDPGPTVVVEEDDDIQSLEHSMANSRGVAASSEDVGSTMEC